MDKRLLIVEEDQMLSNQLYQFFSASYVIDQAEDGLGGIIKAAQTKPDVIILSYSIPKLNGIEVCQQLRTFSDAPIVMVGSSFLEDDIIDCFAAGADDVVRKPFGSREINSRINVHLRKKLTEEDPPEIVNLLKFGCLSINKLTHKAYIDADEITLTRKEFSILWMLVKNQNEVVTRKELIRVIWGYDQMDDDRMIDTHLNRIRKKLLNYTHSISITTIWGIGYKIEIREVSRRNASAVLIEDLVEIQE